MSFGETIPVLAFWRGSFDGDVSASKECTDSTSNDFLVKVSPDYFWCNSKLKKKGLEGCQDGFLGECFKRLDEICTSRFVYKEDAVINTAVGSNRTKTNITVDDIAVGFAGGGGCFGHPRRFDGSCLAWIKSECFINV